jgi:hypothetical protein
MSNITLKLAVVSQYLDMNSDTSSIIKSKVET